MCLGLLVSTPSWLIPLLFPSEVDKKLPLTQQYWLKANIWVAIFSYVGNYFWTHYFYKVLHAYYSFPVDIQLNKVPFFLYMVTHAYFITYHTFTTIVLRRFFTYKLGILYYPLTIIVVFILSYVTALMEAVTIASVPYYYFEDRVSMYIYGSAFYGIYFYVSFPMFYRIDEHKEKWSISRCIIDSLAACMLVTIILDLTRLALEFSSLSFKPLETLPWLI